MCWIQKFVLVPAQGQPGPTSGTSKIRAGSSTSGSSKRHCWMLDPAQSMPSVVPERQKYAQCHTGTAQSMPSVVPERQKYDQCHTGTAQSMLSAIPVRHVLDPAVDNSSHFSPVLFAGSSKPFWYSIGTALDNSNHFSPVLFAGSSNPFRFSIRQYCHTSTARRMPSSIPVRHLECSLLMIQLLDNSSFQSIISAQLMSMSTAQWHVVGAVVSLSRCYFIMASRDHIVCGIETYFNGLDVNAFLRMSISD